MFCNIWNSCHMSYAIAFCSTGIVVRTVYCWQRESLGSVSCGLSWGTVGSLKLDCHLLLCAFILTTAMPCDGFISYSKNPVFKPLKLPQSPGELKYPGMGMLLDKCRDVCKGCLGQSMSLLGQSSLMPADVCGSLSTEVRKHLSCALHPLAMEIS